MMFRFRLAGYKVSRRCFARAAAFLVTLQTSAALGGTEIHLGFVNRDGEELKLVVEDNGTRLVGDRVVREWLVVGVRNHDDVANFPIFIHENNPEVYHWQHTKWVCSKIAGRESPALYAPSLVTADDSEQGYEFQNLKFLTNGEQIGSVYMRKRRAAEVHDFWKYWGTYPDKTSKLAKIWCLPNY